MLWDQVNEIAHRPDGTILEVEAIAAELIRRFGFPAAAHDAVLQAVNRRPIHISAKFGSSTVIRSEGPTADGS
jgi:hypothetical protein